MPGRVLLDVDYAARTMGLFGWRLLYHLDERLRAVRLSLSDHHRRSVLGSDLDAVSVPMSLAAAAGYLSVLSLSHDHHRAQPVRHGLLLAVEGELLDSATKQLRQRLQLLPSRLQRHARLRNGADGVL